MDDSESGDTGSKALDDPKDVASTARAAIDKLGAELRTAVHDALGSVASDRPGSDDKAALKIPTAKDQTKRWAKTVERLLPAPAVPSHPEADTAVEPAKAEPPTPAAVTVDALTRVAPPLSAIGREPGPKIPEPKIPAPSTVDDVEGAVTGAVATVINTVLNPFSLNSAPDSPAEPPAAWAMLAFARREFEHALRQPQDLLTRVSTLSNAVTAQGPVALAPGIVVPPELADHVIATPGPSLTDQITVFGMEALKQVSQVIGVNITMKLGELITTPTPPWFTTIGLTVTKGTYEGGDVWVITPPNRTDERVIAVHGSGFVYDPNIIHWMDYTQMARETGATVVVPRYPLIPDGGTAEKSVPPMADFIANEVETYGAENVSIYADSAGGTLSALAVQKIVRDCNGDSGCLETRVPSRMVLLSPGLNGEEIYTDPNVELVNDPVVWLTEEDKEYYGQWASGPEELWNPLLGPTDGMPPTTIYVGSREQAAPGALRYAERMVDADPNADVTVVIGMGQIHDWAQGGPIPINSQSANYRDDVYRQLGIVDDTDALASVSAADAIALAPGIVVPDSLIDDIDVTDAASVFDQVTVLALTAFREISQVIGVDITTSLGGGIAVPDPPPILTLGLDVRATEFTAQDANGVEQTWQVWEISNPRSDSDEHVIAFHGGGLVTPPNIFHWLDYAQMSRQTGATVIVPRYPLIPDGGTADNTIPPAADLIAAYVTEHGAENVSVYGESSGGMIAVLAVQKIVRDCEGDTQCLRSRVPSRMVLSSPGLTDPEVFTDPNVVLVNDPLFGVPESDGLAQWRSQQDPELSDTFLGPVEGLPRTTIYIGTREIIAPGALKFAESIDDAGGDVSVVIGMGQMHGWATLPINSQYANYRDDVYRQLGIVDETVSL
ncbi:alpha/beta hydrolase fold domain-containing protein [Mycolicibacterium setense]|uniref:alpha/beta hydrolase fold domain-containing protein n=1 Tax=Mycolicibacterium setense TaxID=431269 RepID=UPI000691BD6C|nr:alpha/beta hydrolase fold domain-containing protein [Mycolicibacterium setense]